MMTATTTWSANPMPVNDHVINSVYGRPIEILLVEDSEDDASVTMDTLAEGRVRNNVTLVEDGVEALTYLRREGRYATSPRPDLILLDLNLPRKNGHEVLAEIKEDHDLKHIPVVMLSSHRDAKSILESYQHHANCYVAKPLELDDFIGAVRRIEDFWISFVKLPAA